MTTIQPINETLEKIWAIIQRPFPHPTKAEILAILREGYGAPTASEEPLLPMSDELYELAKAKVLRAQRAKADAEDDGHAKTSVEIFDMVYAEMGFRKPD